MIQITYVSDASNGLAPDEVFRVVEASASNNLRDDLTGFLIFSRNRFFQLLEGPEDRIDDLLARLKRDPRHGNIEVLSRAAITERSFPRWQMKRLPNGPDMWNTLDEAVGAGNLNVRVRSALLQFCEREQRVST